MLCAFVISCILFFLYGLLFKNDILINNKFFIFFTELTIYRLLFFFKNKYLFCIISYIFLYFQYFFNKLARMLVDNCDKIFGISLVEIPLSSGRFQLHTGFCRRIFSSGCTHLLDLLFPNFVSKDLLIPQSS